MNTCIKKILIESLCSVMIIIPCVGFAESESETSLSSPPGNDMPGGGPGGAPGSDSSSVLWSGATTITSAATETGKTYSSTTASQNALLIDTSDAVTISDATVTKTGGTSASDSESFYGTNSGIMVKGGSTTTIKNSTITTSAAGANGVFSYGGNASTNATSGDGTTVNISDSTIKTTGDGSGGIMTTGYGTTNASNLTITTEGQSSAAIRSDRGGGFVNVDGGSYTTSGVGSPAIYATATINVKNAKLTSTASQGVVNEGGNTVVLEDCTVNASNKSLNSQDYFRNSIFLYQSMSGDASNGASVFKMTGGALNSSVGHVFHVTNTSAAITLEGVEINNTDSENVLISVCDDAWSGLSNSATLNAKNQTLTGDLLVGSDSSLDLKLSGTSVWTGTTSGKITTHKNSSTISSSLGTVNVTLADEALIVLTADTKVSSISGTGKINYNGYALTVGSKTYTSGSPGVSTITETSGTASDVDNSSHESSSEETVTKEDQSMSVTAASARTYKASKLKKASKTYKAVTVKNAEGTVTYKVTGNKKSKKYLKFNSKTGKVTVKKGTPKGTYTLKIKVTASGNDKYNSCSKTVSIKVKVK